MRQFTAYEVFVAFFCNGTAAVIAVLASLVLTPVYLVVLPWLVHRVRAGASSCCICGACGRAVDAVRRLCAAKQSRATHGRRAVVEPEEEEEQQQPTPRRQSAGSRRSSAARESAMFFTPGSIASTTIPESARRSRSSSSSRAAREEADAADEELRRGGGASILGSPSTLRDGSGRASGSGALDLTIDGKPVKLTYAPASVAAAATARRGASLSDDAAIAAAEAAGEVLYQPARRLPSVEQRVRRLFQRHVRSRLYRASNITTASLSALFEGEAFQAWYADHRTALLEEARVRHNGIRLRGVSSLVTLLLGLFALPAYSFSNKATATFFSLGLPAGTPLRHATFAQLLQRRANYVVHERAALRLLPKYCSSSVAALLSSWIANAEVTLIVVAVCGLLTSALMPRGSRHTAAIALWSLAVILLESTAQPTGASAAGKAAIAHIGAGVGVVIGVVVVSVAKAMQ